MQPENDTVLNSEIMTFGFLLFGTTFFHLINSL